MSGSRSPQVKVCGLTRVDEALASAQLGVDAVGLVFYPPSPRFVSDEEAREIAECLPESIWKIGVFVDVPPSDILRKVEKCRLSAVQLHGGETPEVTETLEHAGVKVIKSLFLQRTPFIAEAPRFRVSAYLVESGNGQLPGGNAEKWEWGAARKAMGKFPCILAGGLNPENVAKAIEDFSPDAVDVSSGVEFEPGRKDISKIQTFLEAVRNADLKREPRRIFA